jgi:cobalt-zinc-cadmium efflux system outer membrane protein
VAELTLALAKASRWQDVGLGLAGQLQRSEDAPTGLQRDNFVGLQISLPLPFWNRNQGRITEAREAVSRLELESRAVEVRIRSEVDSAWARLRVAEASLKGVDERLLPAAREVEATIARMRSEGQAGLTDLLQARDGRFQAESMRVDALRDVELARGRVGMATGTIGKEGKP